MMKKMIFACVALCLMLICAAPALMEEPVTVHLGDGAPLAYFDGFTSNAVADPSLLAGVTGAVDASLYVDYAKSGMSSIYELVNHTVQIQNIAVTDDYVALFMRLVFDKEIQFPEGRMQYHINRMATDFPLLQGEEYVLVNPVVREGYLLDDKTLACMVVYPVEQPLDFSVPLTMYAGWAEKESDLDHLSMMLDASQRNDGAKVIMPGLTLPTQPSNARSVSTTTVTRIAATPFGLRVVLDVLDDGRTFGFGYAVLDGEGRYLPGFKEGWRSHSLASAEHPQHVHNELWLLESDMPDQLQFVPVQIQENAEITEFYYYVPFGDMPVDITLESGTVVHIEGVDMEADGYVMRYTLPMWTDFGMDIDLANAQGERLNLNVVTIDMPNLREETLGHGGYWSEMYKDQMVARVTPEQLAQATGLAFHGWEYGSKLLMDQAVMVNMK